jgi:hypothetical protein
LSVTLSAITVIVSFQFVACDQLGGTKSNTPKTTYTLPEEFIFEPSAERGTGAQIFITGRTNLPDGLRIGVEVPMGKYRMTNNFLRIPWKDGFIAQDFHISISDGKFHSRGFMAGGKPLPPGKTHVHFLAHFNGAWQTPEILAIFGRGGNKLHGPLFKLEEPDVIDSDTTMDYVATLDFPKVSDPAKEQRTKSSEPTTGQRAIELVKKAVLVVDSSRSSMTVEDGFAFYRKDPEIRLGTGWSAAQSDGNNFLVTLVFINGKMGEAQAIWSVDMSTKKVKYINKAAKAFSWIPAN